jgi:hypothetical protein
VLNQSENVPFITKWKMSPLLKSLPLYFDHL